MQSVYLIIMAGLISLLTHVVQTEAQGIPTIFAKVGQPGTEEMVSIPSKPSGVSARSLQTPMRRRYEYSS